MMSDLSDIQSGIIIVVHLAEASVMKTANLVGVVSSTVSTYDRIQKTWEDTIEKEQWLKVKAQ